MLTFAALTALALTCTQNVAPESIAALAIQESGGNPLAINDNHTKQAIFPASVEEFTRIAIERLRAGHRLALGLMQISTGNMPRLQLTIEEAADPCKSMTAGATVLEWFAQYNCGLKWHPCLPYARQVAHREHAAGATVGAAGVPQPAAPKQAPLAWNGFGIVADDEFVQPDKAEPGSIEPGQ